MWGGAGDGGGEGAKKTEAPVPDHSELGCLTLMNAYGDLLRRLGRDAEAEPVERELLKLLSEADEDHVIAAKLRARYGGSTPTTTTTVAR